MCVVTMTVGSGARNTSEVPNWPRVIGLKISLGERKAWGGGVRKVAIIRTFFGQITLHDYAFQGYIPHTVM